MRASPFLQGGVADGKLSYTLQYLSDLREDLLALDAEQALPHLWRGLPPLYASLFGLAYDHGLAYDLAPGTFYYSRTRQDEALTAPTLLLAQRGYAPANHHAGRTVKLQIELLKRLSISGEHGGHIFERTHLLEEEESTYRPSTELPAGVRAGRWVTLHIPKAIWTLQSGQFAQIPAVLLRCHDLYTINLGLVLKSEEAYKGGREKVAEAGHTLTVKRLMDQAGLRQPFRVHASRDRARLDRALGDLETLGILTHLEDEESTPIESEELATTMEFPSFEESSSPLTSPRTKRRRVPRRRFVSACTHRKVRIYLYRRVFDEIGHEKPTEAKQGVIPSTG